MVGQESIKAKLNSFDIYDFPHSILFVGDKGCGKRTLTKEIAKNKLDLIVEDLTDNISSDSIDNINCSASVCCYLIDIDELTDKQQNVILKFVEEPPENAYLFLITSFKNLVLNTIINRCMVFEFETYTKEQLEQLVTDKEHKDLILDYCNTPELVINTNGETLQNLIDLCKSILENMKSACIQNALTLVNKFNLKDEYDKFDINLFFECFLKEILFAMEKDMERCGYYINLYSITNSFYNKQRDKRLNKKYLLNNFILQIWLYSQINH